MCLYWLQTQKQANHSRQSFPLSSKNWKQGTRSNYFEYSTCLQWVFRIVIENKMRQRIVTSGWIDGFGRDTLPSFLVVNWVFRLIYKIVYFWMTVGSKLSLQCISFFNDQFCRYFDHYADVKKGCRFCMKICNKDRGFD